MTSADRILGAPLTRRSFVAITLAVPVAATHLRAPGARAASQTVTMVTDTAGLGDQNFNDLANKGGMQAAKDFGVTFKVIESQDASAYVPNLTQAAEQSVLSIGVGFNLIDAITAVAKQNPDKKFLLIDATSDAPNVAGVTFKEQEGAFLAGIVAGKFTKTNKVGVIGGQKIPPVIRYQVGFQAGVKSVNPGCQVLISYADTFGDPNLGNELTLAQYNNGADIAFPVAGRTGIGTFTAAQTKGKGFWVIAADTDQDHLAPGFQLCFAQKGVDTAVYTFIKELVAGTFKAGSQTLGLKEHGVGLSAPGGRVPADILGLVEGYKQLILAGTLTVPSTEDELKSFTPPAAPSPVASPAASPAS